MLTFLLNEKIKLIEEFTEVCESYSFAICMSDRNRNFIHSNLIILLLWQGCLGLVVDVPGSSR